MPQCCAVLFCSKKGGHKFSKDKTVSKQWSKTNQIEALRKKYEALIQDDRKRKERNEYILEKMDNMRTSTALVHTNCRADIQLASGPLPNLNNRLVALQPRTPGFETHSYQSYHHKAPQVSDNGNASSLLRDIYNKFILIPKRWPSQQPERGNNIIDTNTNTIEQTSTNENSDWKTKYEILNKLKQDEKECIGNDRTNSVQSEHHQEYGYPNHLSSQYEPVLPEDDVSNNVTLKDKNDGNEKNNDIFSKNKYSENRDAPMFNDKEKLISDKMATAGKETDSKKNIQKKAADPGEINSYPFTKIEGSTKIEHDDDGINPAHISYPPENIGKPFGDVPDVTDDEQFPIEVINVEEFTPRPGVTVKDGVNVNPNEYGLNKSHFEQFSSHEEFSSKTDTKDGDNVNSDKQGATQEIFEPDSSHHEPEINKLDTGFTNTEQVEPNKQPENPEMALVTEESSKGPHNAASYDTDQTTPVSEHMKELDNPSVELGNTEIEGEMFYPEPINEFESPLKTTEEPWDTTQNQNFEQNEQYYYEGPHEMPESVHINEHEETSVPYDQNYEQQYNIVNYEQQQYDEMSQPFNPPQVAYDQPQKYEAQQYEQQEYDQSEQPVYDPNVLAQYNPEAEYDPQQYAQENYDTVQQVEEQLTQEEGYTETQNEQQEQQFEKAVNP